MFLGNGNQLINLSYKQTLLLSFFVFVLSIPRSQSQSNNAEAALYNIGVGSVLGGIGAIINKRPEEKLGNIFFKGMAQGALGGYLVYESKILISKIAKYEKLEYGWPAKFVNSAGISIIENAASNRNFWEQWNLNIGFNRIEFHTKDRFKVKYKIMPVALLLTGYTAFHYDFEGTISLRTGEFAFSEKSHEFQGRNLRGATIGTSFFLVKDSGYDHTTISHEIIHIFQYYDFHALNAYVNKPLKEFEEGSLFFKKANKIFHYDFNFAIRRGLYMAENINVDTSTLKGYNENFFEREAYYYSNK